MISKSAFAAALLIAGGLGSVSVANAQNAANSSVIVNYGALDQMEDAAPAAPVDPATYARGNGYPFAVAPPPGPINAYGAHNPYGYSYGSPAASPAGNVQATQTHGAPSVASGGYNKAVILGSPEMSAEARRSGQLPYSAGTRQYRAEIAQQIAHGSRAYAQQPSGLSNSSFDYQNQDGSLPRRTSAYTRDGRPTAATSNDGLPRRTSAYSRDGRPAAKPTQASPSAYHRSNDGLVRRVSAQSGTQGVTKAMLIEAAQAPTGLPTLLAIKFQRTAEDLTMADRQNLKAVVADLGKKYDRFEIVAQAADNNNRVAKKRSLDRAVAVRNYLISNGISANRITIRARGAVDGAVDQVKIGGSSAG